VVVIMADNANPNVKPNDTVKQEKASGPKLKDVFRLHTSNAQTVDFESEDDLLDFVKEASTVKQVKDPDGSTRNVYSVNSHLVHGAAHPDYPNLRVEKVQEVEFPGDDE
jgi:hypothetical protein